MRRYSEYIYFCGVVLGWLLPTVHSQSNDVFVSNEPATNMLLDEPVLYPSEESVTVSTDLVPENKSSVEFSTESRFDYDNITLTNELLDFEDVGVSNSSELVPGEPKTPIAINYENPSNDFDYRYPPSYDYSYDGLRNGTNRIDYGNPFGVIQTIFGGFGNVLADPFNSTSHHDTETKPEVSEKAGNATDISFSYRMTPLVPRTFGTDVFLYRAPPMMNIPERTATQDLETTTWKVGYDKEKDQDYQNQQKTNDHGPNEKGHPDGYQTVPIDAAESANYRDPVFADGKGRYTKEPSYNDQTIARSGQEANAKLAEYAHSTPDETHQADAETTPY
ncbi:SCO1/SenC [Anopheles sinensis]|uniref:SCO1/SenC n=1 Tax=Anopheles sinensis TaxID=74873 RepID=A0A084WTD3_ANOSI|nr:SCO1/SenC [Anopheles sinensis]